MKSLNEQFTEEQELRIAVNQIRNTLQYVYEVNYSKYLKYYTEYFKSFSEMKRYAQSHALIEVVNILQEKCNRAMIYEVCMELMDNKITLGENPVFKPGNSKYFWRKILMTKIYPIDRILIHGARQVLRGFKRIKIQ